MKCHSIGVITIPASEDFHCLLTNFANSFDADQALHSVGPDVDPNCLTLMLFLMDFFLKKKNYENIVNKKKTCKITQIAKN